MWRVFVFLTTGTSVAKASVSVTFFPLPITMIMSFQSGCKPWAGQWRSGRMAFLPKPCRRSRRLRFSWTNWRRKGRRNSFSSTLWRLLCKNRNKRSLFKMGLYCLNRIYYTSAKIGEQKHSFGNAMLNHSHRFSLSVFLLSQADSERSETSALKRENQSLVESCDSLEKARQKLGHDLGVKEQQVSSFTTMIHL